MKRRVVLVLLAIAASFSLAGGVALAATLGCAADRYCEGTPGDDEMEGTAGGGEAMYALGGDDVVSGFGGFDLLSGGPGDDRLKGGRDGDIYRFEDGWGADFIADRAGYDALDFSPVTTPVVVDLAVRDSSPEARSESGKVNFKATSVIEQVGGTALDDEISGSGADDSLEGDNGDDRINGRGGADGIGGGGGDDTITGGPGRDIIWSRSGDDTIYIADGKADVANCGDGADTVYFDPELDELGGKCDNLNPPE